MPEPHTLTAYSSASLMITADEASTQALCIKSVLFQMIEKGEFIIDYFLALV